MGVNEPRLVWTSLLLCSFPTVQPPLLLSPSPSPSSFLLVRKGHRLAVARSALLCNHAALAGVSTAVQRLLTRVPLNNTLSHCVATVCVFTAV